MVIVSEKFADCHTNANLPEFGPSIAVMTVPSFTESCIRMLTGSWSNTSISWRNKKIVMSCHNELTVTTIHAKYHATRKNITSIWHFSWSHAVRGKPCVTEKCYTKNFDGTFFVVKLTFSTATPCSIWELLRVKQKPITSIVYTC